MRIKSILPGASLFPLFVGAVILASFGLYYSVHTRSQQEYLYDRNFRQLALMGNQLQSRIDGLRTVLLYVPKKTDTVRTNYNIRRYLTRASFQEIDSARTPEELGIATPGEVRNKNHWSQTWLLRSETGIWIEFVDVDTARTTGWETIVARVALRQLVNPSFADAVFDDILLVAPDGDVVYQQMSGKAQIMRLDSVDDPQGRSMSFTGQDITAGLVELQLAGITYDLFHQPLTLPPERHVVEKESARQLKSGWSICGLVIANTLNKEAKELPSTVLIVVVLLLMIVSLSWPLLKVWFMGAYDRPTRVDVSLVIVALMLGSTLLTFVILDFMYIRLVIEPQMNLHLKAFADSMNSRFDKEISAAVTQLDAFSSVRQRDSDRPPQQKTRYRANILNPSLTQGHYPSIFRNFETVFWADGEGKQVEKWSSGRGTTPNVNVKERDYFKNVREHKLYHLRGLNDRGFSLEPQYSWTSGEFQLAISIPDTTGQPPGDLIAVMLTRPASVVQPVTVPGYSFCIINHDGGVLFHSIESRSLRENLFDELEPDNDLRAAVFAQSASSFNANYWGVEQRVYVRPMDSLPWFIVVFRDRAPLRTSNLEILTSCVVLILLYVVGPVLMLLFLTRKTQWTADWIWPHPRLANGYRQLTVVYMFVALVLLSYTFWMKNHVLEVFISMEVMACLLMYLTYLRLDRKRYRALFGHKRRIRRLIAVCAVGFPVSILVSRMANAAAAVWLTTIPYVFLDVVLFGMALLFFVTPRWWRITRALTSIRFKRSYIINSLLITGLTSVYPAYMFFGISYDIQAELFVKHAQQQVGRALQERARDIRNDWKNLPDTVLTRFLDDPTAVYTGFFFNTMEYRVPGEDSCLFNVVPSDWKYRLFSGLTAPYNTRSTEMRELLHDAAADSSLVWNAGPPLLLHTLLPGTGEVFHISTVVPGFMDWADLSSLWAIISSIFYVLMFAGLAIVLYALVRSIALRVFLVEAMGGRERVAEQSLRVRSRRNLLVLSSSPRFAREILQGYDLHFIDIAGKRWNDLWDSLGSLHELPPDTPVAIDHFEEGMNSPDKNLRKLQFVEEILYVHRRSVVLVSSVDPRSCFALRAGKNGAGPPGDEESRWKTILATCTRLHYDDRGEWRKFARELLTQGTSSGQERESGKRIRFLRKTIFEECHHSADLQQIGNDVFAECISRQALSPFAAVNEILNRGRLYYHHLWLACSPDERRVLHHVALGGYVSYENRAIVRGLQERGLLVRSPNLRIMSKGLLKFLLSTHMQEELRRTEEGRVRTGWSTMRIPFFLLLAGVVLFLFVTQQDVLNSTIAFMTVLSALVPAAFRFVGMMTSGKSPAEPTTS